MFPVALAVVFENAVEVCRGHVNALVYVPGDDSCVDILLHPNAIPGFIAKFFPAEGRLN